MSLSRCRKSAASSDGDTIVAIQKVQRLRQLIGKSGSKALIEIDGGVQNETAPRLVKAGADVLVAGSYVFGSQNPEQVISALKAL